MPTYRIPAALITMYYSQKDHPPWCFARWKEITGIKHGLFPDDDALLPKGWDRSTAKEVQSFFEKYKQIAGEEDRKRFASRSIGQEVHPGRDKWLLFCSALWKRCKLHDIIVDAWRKANLHPVDIKKNLEVWSEESVVFPNCGDFLGSLADVTGSALFGDEALLLEIGATGALVPHLRSPSHAFVVRSWDALKAAHNASSSKLPGLEAEAEAMLTALNDQGCTSSNFRRAMKAVSNFLLRAQVSGTQQTVERAEQLRAEIENIFEKMGKKVRQSRDDSDQKPKGLCKLTKDNLNKLAKDEDVEDLLRIYNDLFSDSYELQEDPSVDSETLDEAVLREFADADLGVEEEQAMDINALCSALGYIRGLPFIFNLHRHKAGFNPWDTPDAFDPSSPNHDPENIIPSSLHWHQLAGVHSIFRTVLSLTPFDGKKNCKGMLITDEVGLGKTAMVITVLATLSHLIWLNENSQPLPPLFRKYRFLDDTTRIPSLPHLIVVPPTLMAQWEKEIKTFVQPHKVDILLYHANKNARSQFWAANGPFEKAKHQKHQIIIIASDSALMQDFLKGHYSKVESKYSDPWTLPNTKKDGNLANTLFSKRYLTVTFDEAHRFKNGGLKFWAGLRLKQQAIIKLACTATPLQTSPKDIPNLGRLIGIPHFFTQDYLAQEKIDTSTIRRAKRDEDPDVLIQEHKLIIGRLQKNFKGHLLRRTTKSKNWEGGELINLPPLVEIVGVLKLTEEEMTIIEQLSDDDKDAVLDSNGQGKRSLTRRFFLNHRTSILSLTLGDKPTLKTLDDWKRQKSTKLDAFVRICQHYLSRDDAPHVYFEDGKLMIPESPSVSGGQVITQKRRICAYVEFTQFYSLIKAVLDLHGIPFLWLDGQVPWEKRDEIVKKLYTDGNPRLLIFSSVGSTGVNMAIADVMIHVDVCWSDQDMRQINGRIHRQPQDKTVHVIHLLADETSDVIMYTMAKGKKAMLEAFVNRSSQAEDLHDLLCGRVLSGNGDDEIEVIDEEAMHGNKRRRSTRKRKGQEKTNDGEVVKEGDVTMHDKAVGVSEASNIEGERNTKPKKRSGRKGKARKGAIEDPGMLQETHSSTGPVPEAEGPTQNKDNMRTDETLEEHRSKTEAGKSGGVPSVRNVKEDGMQVDGGKEDIERNSTNDAEKVSEFSGDGSARKDERSGAEVYSINAQDAQAEESEGNDILQGEESNIQADTLMDTDLWSTSDVHDVDLGGDESSDGGTLNSTFQPPQSASEGELGISDEDEDVYGPSSTEIISFMSPLSDRAYGDPDGYPSSLPSPIESESGGHSPEPKRHKPSPARLDNPIQPRPKALNPFAPRNNRDLDAIPRRRLFFSHQTVSDFDLDEGPAILNLGDNVPSTPKPVPTSSRPKVQVPLGIFDTPTPIRLQTNPARVDSATSGVATGSTSFVPVVGQRYTENKGKRRAVSGIIPSMHASSSATHSSKTQGPLGESSSSSTQFRSSALPTNRLPTVRMPGSQPFVPLPPANATKRRPKFSKPSKPSTK